MSIIANKQDYYFGAALCSLFNRNNGFSPTIIDSSSSDSRAYLFTVNNNPDFYMYMKHTESCRENTDGSLSWKVKFTNSENSKLLEYYKTGCKVFVLIICSQDDYYKSRFLLLTYYEYSLISEKSSLIIKINKADKRLKNGFDLYCNRKAILTDIAFNRLEKDFHSL